MHVFAGNLVIDSKKFFMDNVDQEYFGVTKVMLTWLAYKFI